MRKNSAVIKMREKMEYSGRLTALPPTYSSVSTLMLIQKTVQHFVSLLSNVLHLEVEVVDNQFRRIAGTGLYGKRLGEVPNSNTLLLEEVLEKQREVVVFDSRKNMLCSACTQRESCQERGFVGVPIIHQQYCLGVISLVAVTSEQLQHLREHTSVFIEYIRHISTLLVANILSFQRKDNQRDPFLLFLVNNINQGVIIFDEHFKITYINASARSQLNISGDMSLNSALITPCSTENDEQLFTFCLDETCWQLRGRWYDRGSESMLLLSTCHHQPADAALPYDNLPIIKDLLGESAAMRKLKSLIGRIASSPSSVMILGESGTGKEVVARAIHRLSKRHDKPFVAINCAAIPENLLESELFGYAKGAFTGAAPGGKKGLIQLANSGTLFLDEIGDMPLALQARLLRALESREVMPIGASQAIPVDIRIVSATHQNLQEKVERGEFREDLYYRLNVIPLCLPPLREREGDVELLLNHFLISHAQRIGHQPSSISSEVLRLLSAWRWPGNVRELSNLVEYLINVVPDGAVIDSSLLPPIYHSIWQPREVAAAPVVACSAVAEPSTPAGNDSENVANLRTVEKTLIEEALMRTRNKKQIADELGIGVATLYRKIKKYGLG
ncbi:sigma 54-interacting transcriptional regulator [Mixta tenebrionis]|nr:Limonene hydroxylase [Mixta theicola]